MSFTAVAYVPAFLENRQRYVKEHHNGLHGATASVVSNFLIGIPYLFALPLFNYFLNATSTLTRSSLLRELSYYAQRWPIPLTL